MDYYPKMNIVKQKWITDTVLKPTLCLNTAFFMIKAKIPNINRSTQWGYIPTKTCSECLMNKIYSTQYSHSQKKKRAKPHCAHDTKNYTLVSTQLLKFLLEKKELQVEDISHMIVFGGTKYLQKFVNDNLELRFRLIEEKKPLRANLAKMMLNVSYGAMLISQLKPRVNYFITGSITTTMRQKPGFHFDLACVLKGKNYYTVVYEKPMPTPEYIYSKQGLYPIGSYILATSKYHLNDIFFKMENGFATSKMALLQFSTDSFTLAFAHTELSLGSYSIIILSYIFFFPMKEMHCKLNF